MSLISWKAVAATVLPVFAVLGLVGPQASLAAQAKQPTQEELVHKRDEKFALPVFKKADWTFDYDAAREEAKKSGKVIFAYFSRSYAA